MFGKECYSTINENLNRAFDRHKVLIAVHRGEWGGNIIDNTVQAFQMALDSGADMFELDVSRSTDGVLYTFHDGNEKQRFGIDKNIETLSSSEIDDLEYINTIGLPSGGHAGLLETAVSHFKNGELYNIDRAWEKLPETAGILAKYPWAVRQALVKSPVNEETLEFLNEYPQKFMFMPIVYSLSDVEKALTYPEVNLVGMELIAGRQEDELFQDETIRYIHGKKLFAWVNAITLSCLPKYVLFGGLDDNMALFKSKDDSWGKLFKKGIDIVQTDWPAQLGEYRTSYFAGKSR
ncbi:MAG: glycerophosphodiester phosphodiesterase family protein [Treponema sp.]|nr:glycerophosphodiester phosphodiesterase family protein [Treponema sp.]